MKNHRRYPKKPRYPNRDENIRSMYNTGITTLDELAKSNGLTKARIHQIIHGRVLNMNEELTGQNIHATKHCLRRVRPWGANFALSLAEDKGEGN